MNGSSRFFAHAGYKFWLAYKGQSGILRYARQFEPLFDASPETLDNLRSELLTKLLRHSFQTSQYYHEIFLKAGLKSEADLTPENFKSIPFFTKPDIVNHLDRIISSAFREDEIIYSSTGGSSGIPIQFCRDERLTLIHRAQDYLFNARIGIRPGTRRAWVWGSPLDVAVPRGVKAKLTNYLTERAIYFYSFDATLRQAREFIDRMNQHRPEVIFAYPNMLASMAAQIEAERLPVIRIPKVVVTAEPLYDWQRQIFQKVFGAATFERYGSREIGTVASEDSAHDGMRIFEPSYIFEVFDKNGNEITDGTPGELVITDLYNYAMPLIRYRTGDIVRISPVSSDKGWRKMTEVGGRVVDMIIRPDGSEISGLAMIRCLRESGINMQLKLVQTSPGELVVKHLKDFNVPDAARNKFQKDVNDIMRGQIKISYQIVDELEYDKSGKYRYITSECSKSRSITGR